MAPYKEPDTLYILACNSCISLLHNSFASINQRHGAYPSEGSARAVSNLQTVLLSTVPGVIWNDLCERLLYFIHKQDVGHRRMFLDVNEFLKFTYALFAHTKLTRIALVNDADHYWGFANRHSPLDDTENRLQFWERIFMNCNKVTSIVFPFPVLSNYLEPDISWMFELIGKHCKNLEKIFFSSTVHSKKKSIPFLLKCTKLRRIEAFYELQCEFSPEKHKHILDSLPELEYFSDEDLMLCFPDLEAGRVLNLTELRIDEKRSTGDTIALVAQICPKLKHLEVAPENIECSSAIFDGLAESTLNLTSLHVWSYFASSNHFHNFFSTKGVHLLKLKFDYCYGVIGFKSLKIIGEICLNLQCLYIHQVVFEPVPVDQPNASDMLIDHRSPVFRKLTTLYVEDVHRAWDHRVIKWCVLHATNLVTLKLDNCIGDDIQLSLDDFREMFAVDRLAELVGVTLSLGPLSREMVQCLYDNCPKMRKLVIDKSLDDNAKEYVKTLKQHIASNNIDLKISEKI